MAGGGGWRWCAEPAAGKGADSTTGEPLGPTLPYTSHAALLSGRRERGAY